MTAFMTITVCVCTQQKDTLFQQFLIAVSLEGLENKYSLELSRGQIKYSISDMYYSGQKLTFSLSDNICCLEFISRDCFYFCEGNLYNNIKCICVSFYFSYLNIILPIISIITILETVTNYVLFTINKKTSLH